LDLFGAANPRDSTRRVNVPSSPDVEVGIIGLRALRADIARMSEEYRGPLVNALKAAGREVCDPIANRARENLPMSDRQADKTHRPGALLGSVRVYATKTGAGVRMGNKANSEAGWIEFGGTRKRPHESHRDFMSRGRYLYPAAYEMAPQAAGRYEAALNQAFDATGLWTNETSNPDQVKD
jgi:hypothetical protein